MSVNAAWNSVVWTARRNDCSEVAALTDEGRAFQARHREGAVTECRAARIDGTISVDVAADQRRRNTRIDRCRTVVEKHIKTIIYNAKKEDDYAGMVEFWVSLVLFGNGLMRIQPLSNISFVVCLKLFNNGLHCWSYHGKLSNNKMAMVSVVYWQPTGGLMVQADRLGANVGSHLALCCIHCMNRVNSGNALSTVMQRNEYYSDIIIFSFSSLGSKGSRAKNKV